MIGKKLLGILLNKNVVEVYQRDGEDRFRYEYKSKYGIGGGNIPVPNKNTLANLSKIYAKKLGYSITSGTEQNVDGFRAFVSKDFTCTSKNTCFSATRDSEHDAVFEVMEWIIEKEKL